EDGQSGSRGERDRRNEHRKVLGKGRGRSRHRSGKPNDEGCPSCQEPNCRVIDLGKQPILTPIGWESYRKLGVCEASKEGGHTPQQPGKKNRPKRIDVPHEEPARGEHTRTDHARNDERGRSHDSRLPGPHLYSSEACSNASTGGLLDGRAMIRTRRIRRPTT